MGQSSILAKMAVQIVANNAQFAAAMKQSQAQMKGFQKTAQGLSRTLGTFGLGIGIYEAISAIQYGVNVMADFEKSMSEVRAITNASDNDFKALKESALELGRTTLFTAKQVSELQVAYGRLGFSTQEILNSTAATLELSTATGEDLAKSADIAGSTLRAFNLDASEMQRVVDVMAASFNKSALGLDNFGESMKYVAPVAAAANISLEETTSMLGVLADAGIRGSMAGTSLRKIISDVGKESGTLSERLQKLADKGLTGADAMDEVGRTAYASLLILTKHIDKVNEGTKAYSNVTGEAKKMADLMSDNLTSDITKLTSAFDGLILKFSEGTGPMRDMVQALTALVTLLSKDEIVEFLKFTTSVGLFVPRMVLKGVKAIKEWNDEGERLNTWLKDMDAEAIKEAFGGPDNIKASEDWNPFGSLFKAIDEGKVEKVQQLTTATKELAKVIEHVALSQTAQRAMSGTAVTSTTTASGFGIIPIDTKSAFNNMEALRNKSAETTEEISGNWIDLSGIVGSSITSLAEGLGSAIIGVEDFGSAVLKAFASFAKEFGSMLIASGVAALALEKLITNPVAAIAAGVALVAIAGAASASLSQAHSGLRGASIGRTPSEVNSGRADFRVKGYDLVNLGSKEGYRRSRVG